MSTILALTILVTLAALAGRVGAHTTSSHDRPWLERHPGVFKERVWDRRAALRQVRQSKCRPAPGFRPELPRQVRPEWRRHHLSRLSRRVERNRGYRSRCFSDPVAAILYVFGPYGRAAVAVADCETGGTFSTTAANGQYLGLFQMGSWERATYGHGATALAQARAAYRYFVASGKDWSPWQCRPDGSLAW